VGFAAVVLAVWVVARNFQPPKAIGHDPSPHGASTAGADKAAALSIGAADAGDEGGPLLLADFLGAGARLDAGAGATMLDGTPVPPLPFTVPRQVRFGVVLVAYAGAQPSAASDRPSSTRSRSDARALADKLAAGAPQDFHAAVQQGDPGSADDVGHVKLGILEPAPEFVLFTLPVDGVSGPVETPRGFWIVKRLE
jgi:hypothetical protein